MRFKHQLSLIIVLVFLTVCSYTISVAFGKNSDPMDSSSNQNVIYIVQKGDTLSAIAHVFHTSTQAITSINTLPNPNFIYVGEHLLVPATSLPLPSATKSIICTLTAYTAGYESTGKWPGEKGYDITSTGQKAIQGLSIAVDPQVIPYGTPVYIPGLGLRIADDTGGAISGHRIDVFYNRVKTALDFGVRKNVMIYLLPKKDIMFRGEFPVWRTEHSQTPLGHIAQRNIRHIDTVDPSPILNHHILPVPAFPHITSSHIVNYQQPTQRPKSKIDVISAFDVTVERKIWMPLLHSLAN